jgi:hypothetical protein
MSLAKWTLIFFATYAVVEAVFVGFAGLTLNISIRALLLPYLELLVCALVLAPVIYWVLQSRERPRCTSICFGHFFLFAAFLANTGIQCGSTRYCVASNHLG